MIHEMSLLTRDVLTVIGPCGRQEKGRQLHSTSYFILNGLLIFSFLTGWFMHTLTLEFHKS